MELAFLVFGVLFVVVGTLLTQASKRHLNEAHKALDAAKALAAQEHEQLNLRAKHINTGKFYYCTVQLSGFEGMEPDTLFDEAQRLEQDFMKGLADSLEQVGDRRSAGVVKAHISFKRQDI